MKTFVSRIFAILSMDCFLSMDFFFSLATIVTLMRLCMRYLVVTIASNSKNQASCFKQTELTCRKSIPEFILTEL